MKLELSDSLVDDLRGLLAAKNAAEFYSPNEAANLALEVARLLPNEPRDMPPGKELDALVRPHLQAKNTYYSPGDFSQSPRYVGVMLDWLAEQGYGATLHSGVLGDNVSVVLYRDRLRCNPPLNEAFYGETPQHALARAIATIGGTDG